MQISKIFIGFLFTILLHVTIFYSGVIEYFDLKIYDAIHKTVNNEDIKTSVVVVDIDEKSLHYLGQWPWSRLVLTNLIKSINSQRPTSVGMDIVFAEHDKTSPNQLKSFYEKYFSTKISVGGLSDALQDNDKIFASALQDIKSVLPVYMNNSMKNKNSCFFPKSNQNIAFATSEYLKSKYILCNIKELQKSAHSVGFINSQRDIDGLFRRVPLFIKYNTHIIPSFGLANLLSVDKLNVKDNLVSILGHTFVMGSNSEVLLDFYEKDKYETISALDVLTHKVNAKKLQGKFVLIGTSAVGLHDRYMISSADVIPGVFVHATLIDNILNDTLRYQPEMIKSINFLLSVLLSVLLVYLLYKKKYLNLLVLFLFFSIVAALFGIYFLHSNIYISIGYFLIPFSLHFFIINVIFIFLHYRDRQKFYKDLTKAHSSAIDSMALVAETRDTDTGAHIQRTKKYMVLLAKYLCKKSIYKDTVNQDFIDLLYRAAPLHDIGKVGIPDSILQKPGKFTDEEFIIMKKHSEIGKNIIQNAMKNNEKNRFLKIAYNIAYYHHEKWDGSGYPCSLKGSEIPLEARIMAIADVYDALISRRCYKLSFSYDDSENIIINGSGTHFDPILVEAFVVLKEKFKKIAESIKE
ncbi:CHASE2 domain-containing protein [Sulfurospirillum arcachonense]|uniref:CHASE2 domain-containing protein n=1 Tax=Sulfurospirillum arcachonense TaxID=57666 RepID=UPI00046AA831|nr:CHASE2 domain-containing protein [Sulfurospirillum arcachonense]